MAGSQDCLVFRKQRGQEELLGGVIVEDDFPHSKLLPRAFLEVK
jgi:hypothetical protein